MAERMACFRKTKPESEFFKASFVPRMYIKTLSLTDFRNVSRQTLALDSKLNLLVGANAQGKTNFLEAIYLLAHGLSFRTNEFRDLIRWEAATAKIQAQAMLPEGEDFLEVQINSEKKSLWRNEKKTSWSRASFGPTTLLAVLFAPEEILVLKGSPQGRRHYIDALVEKLSPAYGKTLKNYHRVVVQRNKLLQDEAMNPNQLETLLETWDAPLIDLGGQLIQERKLWTDRLNQHLTARYEDMSQSKSQAQLIYQPHVESDAAAFSQKLSERKALEKILRRSLVGPHRDDYVATLRNNPVKGFGSQGESRTFTLALKCAEIDLIQEVHQQTPILLLDDVVSELDEARNHYFFHYLLQFAGQVVVTATSEKLLPGATLKVAKTFRIQNGAAKN